MVNLDSYIGCRLDIKRDSPEPSKSLTSFLHNSKNAVVKQNQALRYFSYAIIHYNLYQCLPYL